MNKQILYNLISNPNELNESTLKGIRELVDEHPYFQVARLLLLKNLYRADNMKFESELKRSALYLSDRKRLFELIHDLYPQQVQKSTEKVEEVNKEQKQEKSSSIAVTGNVESVSNYFNIEEVNETLQGGAVEFTFHSGEKNTSVTESDSIPDDQLFDYEKAGNAGNHLNEYGYQPALDGNRSFFEWLSVVDNQSLPGPSEDKKSKSAGKNKTSEIIDKFLNNLQTDIKPDRNEGTFKQKEIKEQDLFESDELMTETLANIYVKQGHYSRALNIFKKMSLKYPEKSVYFAQQIEKLEKLISNQ